MKTEKLLSTAIEMQPGTPRQSQCESKKGGDLRLSRSFLRYNLLDWDAATQKGVRRGKMEQFADAVFIVASALTAVVSVLAAHAPV